ncbi:MAG: hypothetical protein II181_02040, partial [Firmicutes bacterium]|nr:hypothetical protein [Bacillota bacterium]
VYTSALSAYSALSENGVYAIVGDLSAIQVNYPEGEGVVIKYDDMSLVANAVKDPKKKGRWLAECKGQTIESFDKAVVNFKIFDLEDGFIHMEGELANVYYADFDKIKLKGQQVFCAPFLEQKTICPEP